MKFRNTECEYDSIYILDQAKSKFEIKYFDAPLFLTLLFILKNCEDI